MKYVYGRPFTTQETYSIFMEKLVENEKYPEIGWYSVKLKENGKYIGIGKITYEANGDREVANVGYGMLPLYWGQGYATEILVTLVNRTRNIPGIKKLTATVDSRNQASKKVLYKQKFTWYKNTVEDGQELEHFDLKL